MALSRVARRYGLVSCRHYTSLCYALVTREGRRQRAEGRRGRALTGALWAGDDPLPIVAAGRVSCLWAILAHPLSPQGDSPAPGSFWRILAKMTHSERYPPRRRRANSPFPLPVACYLLPVICCLLPVARYPSPLRAIGGADAPQLPTLPGVRLAAGEADTPDHRPYSNSPKQHQNSCFILPDRL